jgi:uncharacterized membrane protein
MASHRVPAALGLRAWLVARLGAGGYLAVFSTVSLLLLWWLIAAAGRAPFVPLWDQQLWHRWAVNLAMPVAAILTAYGVAAPNPFAFEGRAAGFDPARPGIAGLTRQPLLWALALWAGSHLVANGDLAHVALFSPFLALALLGIPAYEARKRREMGAPAWQAAACNTGLVPFAALFARRWRPRALPSPWRLTVAFLGWAALWHLHPAVIGVWPGP